MVCERGRRIRGTDRLGWCLLARFWSRWREPLTFVEPATVLRWRRTPWWWDVLREYLDWRPYSYYTHRFTPLPNGFELAPPAVETIELFPLENGGTSVHWRWRLQDRGPEVRQRFEISAGAIRADTPAGGVRLMKAIKEDAAALALDEPGRPEDGLNRSSPRG